MIYPLMSLQMSRLAMRPGSCPGTWRFVKMSMVEAFVGVEQSLSTVHQ
jgi:hypothetical protein